MRENRSSGSVEGVMGDHDSYSDYLDVDILCRSLNQTESHSRDAEIQNALLRVLCIDNARERSLEDVFERKLNDSSRARAGDLAEGVTCDACAGIPEIRRIQKVLGLYSQLDRVALPNAE